MKMHLLRNTRRTWCGRPTPFMTFIADDVSQATCLTCLKADAAEQRRNDLSS